MLRKWVLGMQIQLERSQTIQIYESRQVKKIMEDGPIEENTHYIKHSFLYFLNPASMFMLTREQF